MVASNLYSRFTKFNSEQIATKDVYLLAGYLHDLGKSGECEVKPVYGNLDHQNPQMSVCKYEFEKDEIIGFRYHTLPAHPEEGYEYLKGYKIYKRFTLQGRNSKEELNKAAQKLYIEDWDKFFEVLKIDEFYKRMIRIAVGAHWYFGTEIRKIVSGQNRREVAKKYLRKLECFYNDEFSKPNRKEFKNIVLFVIIISIADIFGSEYDPRRSLTEEDAQRIINYLPNISLDSIDIEKKDTSSSVVTKIILKALEFSSEATNKKKIFENLRKESEKFMDECVNIIDVEFEFNSNNNYSLLYNLRRSYPFVTDIQRAYPSYFPKAIVFDLDQTLLASKFYADRPVEYYIYPDTAQIIEEVQKLRPKTKVVLITRHYSPKPLKKMLENDTYMGEKNPIYYKNFDLIVARYTGSKETMYQDLRRYPNFFEQNGYPSEGFIMDDTGDSYNIPDNSKFLQLDKASKNGHFDLVRKKFGINYSDIINFDDDKKYFRDGEGMGDAKDVFVAGVLTSPTVEGQGIRKSLFKDGISFYVFNKLTF